MSDFWLDIGMDVLKLKMVWVSTWEWFNFKEIDIVIVFV